MAAYRWIVNNTDILDSEITAFLHVKDYVL
jgi:hypothetical protein